MGDLKDTVTNLHEATASSLITNTAIKLCLHSHSIQAILEGKEGNSDMQRYKESNNLILKI